MVIALPVQLEFTAPVRLVIFMSPTVYFVLNPVAVPKTVPLGSLFVLLSVVTSLFVLRVSSIGRISVGPTVSMTRPLVVSEAVLRKNSFIPSLFVTVLVARPLLVPRVLWFYLHNFPTWPSLLLVPLQSLLSWTCLRVAWTSLGLHFVVLSRLLAQCLSRICWTTRLLVSVARVGDSVFVHRLTTFPTPLPPFLRLSLICCLVCLLRSRPPHVPTQSWVWPTLLRAQFTPPKLSLTHSAPLSIGTTFTLFALVVKQLMFVGRLVVSIVLCGSAGLAISSVSLWPCLEVLP